MTITKEHAQKHKVVSKDEWLKASKEFLEKEKEFTQKRDEISRQRRELPWVKVDKNYVFDTTEGKKTLAELFENHSQLIVYHFMFGPRWKEGCPGCSFVSDHIDSILPHLKAKDVSLVVISRGPLTQIEPFKKRMGWQFKWASSYGSDFNYDYNVSFTKEQLDTGEVNYNYQMQSPHSEEAHGHSVFYKDENGDIFHTYSSYARGCEMMLTTYSYLDILPKGREEESFNPPMSWVRHHDRY